MDIIEPVFHPEVKQIRNKDVSQEKDYCAMELKRNEKVKRGQQLFEYVAR